MKTFRADLHIHTVLSPCGDLSMSPRAIVRRCREKKLDIIGITDHNSTLQCGVMAEAAAEEKIRVLSGIEINTREEVHLLAYFETREALATFQAWIDERLPVVKNKPALFGYQVVVDLDENIVREEERLLITAISAGLDETVREIRRLSGIVIPAHVGKGKNSVVSQLGFVPDRPRWDALETPGPVQKDLVTGRFPELAGRSFVYGSDAHYLDEIGTYVTGLYMKNRGFKEISMALAGEGGREVVL